MGNGVDAPSHFWALEGGLVGAAAVNAFEKAFGVYWEHVGHGGRGCDFDGPAASFEDSFDVSGGEWRRIG